MLQLGCAKEQLPDPDPVGSTPFQELYDQGIDRYLGVYTPMSSTEVSPGLVEHVFEGVDAPICYTGNQFSMLTREGSGNRLLIFLQGGGLCAPDNCAAIEFGIPLIPFGILSPSSSQNPAHDYDLGYVPYCDGSMMMGDREVDSDGDGINDRFFRGVRNLSASLDVIHGVFPQPERIVLAGNSAGGFAVHPALPLVRKLYPDVPIDVINDSGVGVLDPGGMDLLNDYWNSAAFFPADCPTCIGEDGNLTDYHRYQLAEDPNVRLAYISAKQDATIALGLAGGGPSLETQLIEAAAELQAAFPERFGSLIADGDGHTFLVSDFNYAIGSTTVRQWVEDLLTEDPAWTSVSD